MMVTTGLRTIRLLFLVLEVLVGQLVLGGLVQLQLQLDVELGADQLRRVEVQFRVDRRSP